MANEDRKGDDRSAVLPPAAPNAPAAERRTTPAKPAAAASTVEARPPARSTNPPALPSAPPRPSMRFTFAEWFRDSIPRVRRPLKRIAPRIRRSLLPLEDFVRTTVVPWVPRWRGWSPARTLTVTFAFGAFMLALVLLTPHSIKHYVYRRATWLISLHTLGSPDDTDETDRPRADAQLRRDERSPVAGALLSIPPTFASADGAYDLVVHFHGNTELVEESFAVAGINAILVVENLGIGSGPYEDRFTNPEAFRELLLRVDETVQKRGLRSPARRRIALTAWSAGYGAVVRILENAALAEDVDSVILLDGIHASYLPDGSIDALRVAPYERFARMAIANEKLFVITHSEIKPPDYPGTHATTDAVLTLVGVARTPGGEAPAFPSLTSTHGVPKSKIMPLKPLTEAHAGNFHVYGYDGETAEDHIAHLVYMASTALPYLARRWNAPNGG